jgi:hypothetical protein
MGDNPHFDGRRKLPALLALVEPKWLDEAFAEFKSGKREISFGTGAEIAQAAELQIKNVYFKTTGTTTVVAKARHRSMFKTGAVRAAQERVCAAVRWLDPALPEGRHGPDPAGTRRLLLWSGSTPQRWSGSGEPSSTGHPAFIGRGFGRYTSWSDGAIATACSANI